MLSARLRSPIISHAGHHYLGSLPVPIYAGAIRGGNSSLPMPPRKLARAFLFLATLEMLLDELRGGPRVSLSAQRLGPRQPQRVLDHRARPLH